jgi:hypothetical protein
LSYSTDYVYPGDQIPLDVAQREQLAKPLMELIQAHEPQHAERTKRVDISWDLYKGKPKHERRSDPFPDASNVVLNLVRLHSDALSSRLFNSVLATRDLISCVRGDERLGNGPSKTTRWLNRAFNDNDVEVSRPFLGWFREGVPIGEGLMQFGYGSKVQHFVDPASVRGRSTPRVQRVEVHRGPTLHWIPRSCLMWQPGRTVTDAEWVVKQTTMTFSQLMRQTQAARAPWYKDAVEKIKGHSSVLSPFRSLRMGNHMFRAVGPQQFQEYDIREIWVNLPMLPTWGTDMFAGDVMQRFICPSLVIHLHRDTGTILNVMAMPYAIRSWPFLDFSFRGEGSEDDGGVAMMLQHMQAAGTTLLNQAIDVVTIANSMMGVTNQRELLDKKIAPNRWMFVPDPSEAAVRQLQGAKLVAPDVQLIQFVMQFAERLVPAFDREGRSGGHPSPATSTLTLLQESKETLQTTLKMIRGRVSRWAEDTCTLYQQYETPEALFERISRSEGRDDAAEIMQFLQGQGGAPVGFDLRALTEELNPEAARNRAVLVDQATSNFYGRVLQLSQAAANPQVAQNPLMMAVIQKFITATAESYREILDSADVDDIERFLIDLGNKRSADPRIPADLAQLAASRLGAVAPAGAGPAVPQGVAGIAAESVPAPVQADGSVVAA